MLINTEMQIRSAELADKAQSAQTAPQEDADNVCSVDNPQGNQDIPPHASSIDAGDQLIAMMLEIENQNDLIDDQLATIEPAAGIIPDGPVCLPGDIVASIDDLNEIAPAAGGDGGTSGSRSDYGFQSAAGVVTLATLSPIGVIDATALQYNANFLQPRGLDNNTSADPGANIPVVPPLVATINNGADNLFIKEDGQGIVPVTASYTGGGPTDQIVLTMTGVDPAWTVTAPGWVHNGNGTYTLTLPEGQTSYNGAFAFQPPSNSDVDMTGLVVTASVDNGNGAPLTASDSFAVIVDAVVDTPVLTVPQTIHQNWYVSNTSYNTPLNIASYVVDTDGSEIVEKIVIRLDEPFTNPNPPYATLDDMGIGLNKGIETSPGVWEIIVNNGDTDAALDGLMLVVPGDMNYQAIHQSVTGSHGVDIPVISHVNESNLSGQEFDTSDNATTVEQTIHLNFTITPLVLDLNGNGIDLVTIDAGVLFDMNNDGIADNTSWVGADDGLLALDINNDGLINNQSELFGNNETFPDGFKNLSQYDSNQDGQIDVKDTIYSDLVVWRDLNQDGVSQSEEQFSLSDLNIASINLNASDANHVIGDSTIIQVSDFTYENGETGEIVDAAFAVEYGDEDDVQHSIDTFVYHDEIEPEAQDHTDMETLTFANTQNAAFSIPVDSGNANIM